MLLSRNILFPVFGFTLLCVSACGFEPLYATKNHASHVSLAHIAISETTNSRDSALLKSQIEDLFYRDSANAFKTEKPYLLVTSLIVNKKATIVDTDGEIQRFRTTVSSPYTLKNVATDKVITTGSIKRITSYNTSDDNYAEYIVSEDIVKKAVSEIAEEYALRLGAKLNAHQKGR